MTDSNKMRLFTFSLILVTSVWGDTHDHSVHSDHTGHTNTNVQTIEAYNEVDSGDNLKFYFLIRFSKLLVSLSARFNVKHARKMCYVSHK